MMTLLPPLKPGLRTSEGALTALLHGAGFALSGYLLHRAQGTAPTLGATLIFLGQVALQGLYVRYRTRLKTALLGVPVTPPFYSR